MEEYDEFILDALGRGWIEPVFNDDEITMRITPDEDNPLWQAHLKSVEQEVEELVDKGIVEPNGVNEHGDIVYKLTEYGEGLRE